MSPDIVTRGGFVLPGSAHDRYQAQQLRRRRREVREALALKTKVDYAPEQLQADGWGPRQIRRVTR